MGGESDYFVFASLSFAKDNENLIIWKPSPEDTCNLEKNFKVYGYSKAKD